MEEYRTQIKNVIDEMCGVASLDSTFAEDFFNRIIEDGPVLNEFITYLQTGKFLCNEKVRGYSVVDIMVFQLDHFKAFLDREDDGVNNNECQMLLKAFDTFLKMKEDPEKYVRLMGEESGSDYDGKF